jgi:hypothetical protein
MRNQIIVDPGGACRSRGHALIDRWKMDYAALRLRLSAEESRVRTDQAALAGVSGGRVLSPAATINPAAAYRCPLAGFTHTAGTF